MAGTHVGFVYFVRCPINGLIKIGHTAYHPDARLESLRRGSPVELEPMAVIQGGRNKESDLHVRFREFRLHGEWFSPHERLLGYIAKRGKPWPAPTGSAYVMPPEERDEAAEVRHLRDLEDSIDFFGTELFIRARVRAMAKAEKFGIVISPDTLPIDFYSM